MLKLLITVCCLGSVVTLSGCGIDLNELGDGEGAKYEEQVLITENGAELLSNYPENLIIE